MTLTFDRTHGTPLECWKSGKDHMRRFLGKLRILVDLKEFPWAWKLEIHEDSYPHWHLILDFGGRRIPREKLHLLNHLWGFGRVNVKKIDKDEFEYLFKYVSKIPFGCEDEETQVALPQWLLDYQEIKDGRPTTRVRFWQTGGGFYTNVPEAPKADKKENRYSIVPYTYRVLIKLWDRKATVVLINHDGEPVSSRQIMLGKTWQDFGNSLIQKMISGVVKYKDGGYQMTATNVLNNIEPWNLVLRKQVQQMLLR